MSDIGTNLVALYTMEDSAVSGVSLRDQSENGNTGTLVGAPAFVAGRIYSKALSLDGATQYVTIAANPLAAEASWSIALWVKTVAAGLRQNLVAFGVDAANTAGFLYLENVSENVKFDLNGVDGPIGYSGSITMNDGNWHHVVAVCANKVITFYLDGLTAPSYAGSSRTMNTMAIGAGSALIGAAIDHSNKFSGQLDDVRLYTRALSDADVAALYLQGTAADTPGGVTTSSQVKTASRVGCTAGKNVTGNATRIQAALDAIATAGSGTFVFDQQNVGLDDQVRVSSNTVVIFEKGCAPIPNDQMNKSMFVNKNPRRGIPITWYGPWTLTAATKRLAGTGLTFTSKMAQVGDTFEMQGWVNQGNNGFFTVAATNSAYIQFNEGVVDESKSGPALRICNAQDQNITFIGGSWNGNGPNQSKFENNDSTNNCVWAIKLAGVKNLRILDAEILKARTGSILLYNIHNLKADDLTFKNKGYNWPDGGGLQIEGPLYDARIRVTGESDDNLIGLVADDVNLLNEYLDPVTGVGGDIINVDADLPFGLCGTPFRITSLGSRVDLIRVNVNGHALGNNSQPCIIGCYDFGNADFGNFGHISLTANIRASGDKGVPTASHVFIQGGRFENLDIDFTKSDDAFGGSVVYLSSMTLAESLRFRLMANDSHNTYSTGTTGAFDPAIVVAGTVNSMTIVPGTTWVGAPTNSALIGISGAGSITLLDARGVGNIPNLITSTNATAVGSFIGTQAIYGAGTAYSLTNASALVNLGTTPLTLTFTRGGRYKLRGKVHLQFNGATFASSRTVTLKLRRTNNTAADLANGSLTIITGVVTTLTAELGIIQLPEIEYLAAAGDVVSVYADVSVAPTAGSLDAVGGSLVAEAI